MPDNDGIEDHDTDAASERIALAAEAPEAVRQQRADLSLPQ